MAGAHDGKVSPKRSAAAALAGRAPALSDSPSKPQRLYAQVCPDRGDDSGLQAKAPIRGHSDPAEGFREQAGKAEGEGMAARPGNHLEFKGLGGNRGSP